jgi:hypothetical protein
MPSLQDEYDDAMFEFSMGNTDAAIEKQKGSSAGSELFDAQLALGGAYYAKVHYAAAIERGTSRKLRPHDQLAQTNLSCAYMKAGDKTAEHYGLQARLRPGAATWRTPLARNLPRNRSWKWPSLPRSPRP